MRYRSPHRLGCCRTDHPGIGRRELLQVGSLSLLGTGLADLLRLETHAQSSHTKARAKSVVFIFQSGGPSTQETFDPKPEAPDMIRGEYGVTQTKLPGINFCEYLPKLAARNDKFSIVRTMHHVAHPQFRNEHLSCMYLLHTGSTEMPAGDTNATIGQPREGRIEWPSFGSMIAYAAPPVGEPLRDSKSDASGPRAPQAGWPAVVEIPRVSLMNYPGRGAGLLGPKYEHWKVDLAPVCKAPDAAGSCPNCFSHDDPNDPERAAGKGPKAWWDNSSCRDASFHLPNLGVGGVSLPQIESRTELLAVRHAATKARCVGSSGTARSVGRISSAGHATAHHQPARKAEPVRSDSGAGQHPRSVRSRRMGPRFLGRTAIDRSGRADGADQPARLGHSSKCVSRFEREAAAVDRPLPQWIPRRSRNAGCSMKRWS